MWYFENSRTSVMSSINRENRVAMQEIPEEHQPLMWLEEKHRRHMQLFDTEEIDK
jgi:hypothetical protein